VSIYLDNAATTRVADEVAAIMLACLREDFGNPSSAHRLGIGAARRVKTARETFYAAIGDERGTGGELYFTSGGTEADALGVLGAARALAGRGRHVVVTAIEHPAVLGAAKLLDGEGFTHTIVPVGTAGAATPDAIAAAMTAETVVVACMLVNNELGTIQPIAEIVRAVKRRRGEAHVHVDAVQGLGKLPIDVRALGADSVAFSAHKLHGPKGAGALWVKKGARVLPLWSGGGQQLGVRSGTENVPGIAGFAEAARLAVQDLTSETARVTQLRDSFLAALEAANLGARVNCAATPRVPHITSIGFPGVPAEPLLHALEAKGVFVSAGSACASKDKGPSHVLKAIALPDDVGTLRVSFSRATTPADVTAAAQAIVSEARCLKT
jgi:cysteine desulfurase